MKRVLLITDLDNTIYNFMDYFAPTFRGMVHALARTMKIDETLLIQEFREVFKKHHSIEYPFAVQELDSVKDRDIEEIKQLIKVARGAYRRVRNKRFEPYPYVKDTLRYFQDSGVTIVAVSNAPFFQAAMRLKALKIDQYYNGLLCWEGYPVPLNELTKDFHDSSSKAKYKTKVDHIWKLPKDRLKPNLEGYTSVCNFFNIEKQHTYIVGDSISKDVFPALSLGAHGIWAKYGTDIKKKSLETVLSITNWDDKKVKAIYQDSSQEPEFVINNFYELREIIETPQLSLKL